MAAVTTAGHRHLRARVLLGALLTLAGIGQLIRVVRCGVPIDGAGHMGIALAYAMLALTVLVNERWGFFAAIGFPAIGELLGDNRVYEFGASGAMQVVEILIVPTAFYLWRATARMDTQ
ncbi:hypothetical protein [Tsukamurella strandjordii]|uniref:Uncharacterized protein n=1 Tax=Tsukamurella strandjordii TaxID=147577 RepID=A0AA90NRU0_9ACTN|nr:hypothetical protein [Tsukamurella strandjordii]MDP0399634.1 hypothetical protein [Tsukamurella strandjordii]